MSQINTQRYYSSELFGMFARAFSYIGGGLVIVLAYSVYAAETSAEFISEWAINVLGLSLLCYGSSIGCCFSPFKGAKLKSTMNLKQKYDSLDYRLAQVWLHSR